MAEGDALVSFLDRIRNLGAPATPKDADQLLVRQLEGMGADLARPRRVVHVLEFADEASARAAAETVERGGYKTKVEPLAGDGGQWILRAEADRVISSTTVPAFRRWFERVASAHGGEYDGWEAARAP